MADIAIPEARVRQLQTLTTVLAFLYTAHGAGDYRLVVQVLSSPLIARQALEAAEYLARLSPRTGG